MDNDPILSYQCIKCGCNQIVIVTQADIPNKYYICCNCYYAYKFYWIQAD